MKNFLITGLLLSASTLALAKLPALSEEAKGKAAEATARLAWAAKVDTYQLCQWQDRVAASYYASAQAAGKETKPPVATPPCADPGVFTYAPDQSIKPLESSGAHSPAETAVAPPSTKAVDAAINPDKKP